MILIHDIRLPLSAGEPQAYEKALRLARIPRGKVSHLGIARLSVDARHGQPKLVHRDNPIGNQNATPTGYYVRKYIPADT